MKKLLYLLLLISSVCAGQTIKFSALPSASSLTGTEIVPIVQSGSNKKTTTQDVANLLDITGKADKTTTVNGHALSSNVTVTASDVGAATQSDIDAAVTTLETSMLTTTKVLVTGTTTLDATAFGKWHVCSGTSADYTITLPTAVGNEGKMILFKGNPDVAIFSKVITLDGAGTEKIGVDLTRLISTGGYATLIARETSGVGSWDLISFDQGAPIAWTPTFTGYSVAPTAVAMYKRGIGTLWVSITMATFGTSNANTLTITLPPGITLPASIASQRFLGAQITNGGVGQTTPGQIYFNNNDNLMTCYINGQAASWTTSSGKGVSAVFTIFIN